VASNYSNTKSDDLPLTQNNDLNVEPAAQNDVTLDSPLPVSETPTSQRVENNDTMPPPDSGPVEEKPVENPVEKPVQEIYTSELNSSQENVSSPGGGGVYDFDKPSPEVSSPAVIPASSVVADDNLTKAPTDIQNPSLNDDLAQSASNDILDSNKAPSVEEATNAVENEGGVSSDTQANILQMDSTVPEGPEPSNASLSEPTPLAEQETQFQPESLPVEENPNLQTQPSTEEKDYFKPNTFDLHDTSQEIEVPSNIDPRFDALSTPAGIGEGEPTIEKLQEPSFIEEEAVLPQVEDETMPDDEPNEFTTQDTASSGSLDELLNANSTSQGPETIVPPVAFPSSDISDQPGFEGNLDSDEIKKDQAIPSVESVFGGNGADTPTPQDFGLPAPKPKDNSKKKLIIFGIAGFLAVLIIGILLFIFLSGKKDPYPVALSSEQITTISSNVSKIMDEKQDITVTYTTTADLSGLALKDKVIADDKLSSSLAAGFESSGLWLLDKDDNVYVSNLANKKSNKQTYISQTNNTYIYDDDDLKWETVNGYNISTVPGFIDPKSKSSIIYASSIEAATLAGVETINNLNTRVFEIKPQKDFIRSLDFMGEIFTEASYLSTDASNITTKVWIGEDNRIYKILIEGELTVDGDKFRGNIYLNAMADFSYQSVLIKNPLDTATDDPPGQISSENNIEGKEEGEPSSVISEPIIEEDIIEEDIGIQEDDEQGEGRLIDARG
jgi:hypothetical protein